MTRASYSLAFSIVFASMLSCASSTTTDGGADTATDVGTQTDTGTVTDSTAPPDAATDSGAGTDASTDVGTLPDGGALGCANGGAACSTGMMCCAGVPYPAEGRCQVQCNMVSDRALKNAFAAVDSNTTLETLARLPITAWSYRREPGVRHVGPMAQDFHEAFGLGGDDRVIQPVDASGITMAAVQALYRRVVALERANESLRDSNRSLQARVANLDRTAPRARGSARRNAVGSSAVSP